MYSKLELKNNLKSGSNILKNLLDKVYIISFEKYKDESYYSKFSLLLIVIEFIVPKLYSI